VKGQTLTADELFEKLGIERKTPREPITVTEFDRWVGKNHPSNHLEYAKSFWDYVEFVQEIQRKLNITAVRIAGHHVIRTPPPEENLPMPVALLVAHGTEVALKMDFGADQRFPFEWTLSVKRETPYRGPDVPALRPARRPSRQRRAWSRTARRVRPVLREPGGVHVRRRRRVGRDDAGAVVVRAT
jgi:hypothetical protein